MALRRSVFICGICGFWFMSLERNAGTWDGRLCGGVVPGFSEPIRGNECALPYGKAAPLSDATFPEGLNH